MKEKLVNFGIDRTRYYGADLKIISIVRLFQNADKLFKEFSNGINKSITSEKQKKEVNEYTNRYVEICTPFDSLFFISRTLCGKIIKEIIHKLKIVIKVHFHVGEIWVYLQKY